MSLNLQQGSLLINEIAKPFFSGEIHYWRVDPCRWREALLMAKLGGLNFIATYIPWDFHEIHEGYTDLGGPLSYDFTGRTDPRKNLIGFLELAQQEGLYVTVRPGPQILAEWQHKGPALHSFAFDWPDPRYVTALTRWYDAVCKVIVRYQVEQGGPIVLCQVDNESHELTVDGAHRYFTEKYMTVEAFNARFGTDYADLDTAANALCQVMPHNVLQEYVCGFTPVHPELTREFRLAKYWFHEQMIAAFAGMLRARGVTVPLCLNMTGSPDSHDVPAMQQTLDFLGMDMYPPYRVPLAYYSLLENISKYTATTSRWPIAIEFPASSIARAWYTKLGPISADHLVRCALIEAACGILGFNYYMYMDRDLASRSPLDEHGKPSDSYFALFHLHRALQRAGFPATRPVARLALYCHPLRDRELHDTVPDLDWVEMDAWQPTANPTAGYAGLYNALVQTDVDFAVVDYRNLDMQARSDTVLIPGGTEMPAEEYAHLQTLGDRVVWVGEPPARDEIGALLPPPIGRRITHLDELDAAVRWTIRVSQSGVRSYLHRIGDDVVIFLLNLDNTPRTVTLTSADVPKGDVIDCWQATNLGAFGTQTFDLSGYGWRLLRVTRMPELIANVARVEREYF